MLWDIFCKVIDNHGDIGVCWRLARNLALRGQQTRLWVDDASALAWMAPTGAQAVEVLPWDAQAKAGTARADVVVEAFGCDPGPDYLATMAARASQTGHQPVWINLEYLTAEAFAERNHCLPSPVLSGPASGLVKHFFYPGFTPGTGGLLREPGLAEARAGFDADRWLADNALPAGAARRISLFCYEPRALPELLGQFAASPEPTDLLVATGRPQAAVRQAVAALGSRAVDWNNSGRLRITELAALTQPDYDHLLWSCQLNFVRGEDSLVRGLWAGVPLVWQIYPQHDNAHHAKLDAFLGWLQAPASLAAFHLAWNGVTASLPGLDVDGWSACARSAMHRLGAQDDLATQLLEFVAQQAVRG